MAKAYICDRCGAASTGGPEGRVFLESHTLKAAGRGSGVLAQHADLCSLCTTDILQCCMAKPARSVSP